MKKKGLVENLKYKYYLLCNPDEIDMPKNLSEEEQKGWIDQVKEEKEKLERKKGAKQIQKIGSKVEKVKYAYRLIMKPAAIKVPKGLSKKEQEKWTRNLYQKKMKLHEKLGAEKFQNFVLKFDKVKFKFLNKKSIRKKYLKLADKIIQNQTDKFLCKDLTDKQREELLEDERRRKTLIRVELNERKSINYHIGVNRRKEQFPLTLEMNKRIHKDCLKRNGIIFSACIGLGMLGIPIIPQIVGGYQIIAALKNMQCINIQDYNLSRMKAAEKVIVRANIGEINQLREENKELISDISKAKTRGENIDSLEQIVESMRSKESLEQMRAMILQQKQALEETNKQGNNNSSATKQDTFSSQADQIINNATSINTLQSMKSVVLQTTQEQISNNILIGNIKKIRGNY